MGRACARKGGMFWDKVHCLPPDGVYYNDAEFHKLDNVDCMSWGTYSTAQDWLYYSSFLDSTGQLLLFRNDISHWEGMSISIVSESLTNAHVC